MVDCKDCKKTRAEKDDVVMAMRFSHEREVATLERIIKKLWIIILVLIVVLVGTNGAWLWYESQFEDVVTEVTQEVEQNAENGNNSFVGIDNGNAESNADR